MRIVLGLLILVAAINTADAQPFFGRDLSLSGDLIHLMELSGEVNIIDASDPTALVWLGAIDPNPDGPWLGSKVVSYGTTAYVVETHYGSRLSVIDGSNPGTPLVTARLNFEESWITGLAIDVDRALLFVGVDQLSSYDISDPLQPVFLQQIDLDYYRPVADIQLQGETAYCAQGFLNEYSDDIFGIALVDASDPAAMLELTYIANYPTRFRNCFRIDGDLLFSIAREEFSDPNHYFQIHDLSDPYSPQLLAEIVTPRYGQVMRRWENVIYHTDGADGVGRVDVSNLGSPVILDPLPGTEDAKDIEIREDGWLFAVSEYSYQSPLQAFNLEATAAPDDTALGALQLAAWPNPFNPKVSIAFTLPSAQRARVSIHAADGRLVTLLADRPFGAGEQRLSWSGLDDGGRQLASGVYLARVEAEGSIATQRLVLLR